MKEQLYYIQDSRSYTGNCVVWWGKLQRGYTSDLDKAGLYTESEAREICKRETDKAYPKEYIEGKTQRTVDHQYIDWKMRVDFSLIERGNK